MRVPPILVTRKAVIQIKETESVNHVGKPFYSIIPIELSSLINEAKIAWCISQRMKDAD